MSIHEFIRSHVLLNLTPQKNRLGKEVIGYNRKALSRYEKITSEQAEEWLTQDIEKARKHVSKFGLHKNEIAVFLAFYVGRDTWDELKGFFNLLKHQENTKAALILTNSRFLRNNPSLGGILGSKIAKGERIL